MISFRDITMFDVNFSSVKFSSSMSTESIYRSRESIHRGELSLEDHTRQIVQARLINFGALLQMLSKKLLSLCPQI